MFYNFIWGNIKIWCKNLVVFDWLIDFNDWLVILSWWLKFYLYISIQFILFFHICFLFTLMSSCTWNVLLLPIKRSTFCILMYLLVVLKSQISVPPYSWSSQLNLFCNFDYKEWFNAFAFTSNSIFFVIIRIFRYNIFTDLINKKKWAKFIQFFLTIQWLYKYLFLQIQKISCFIHCHRIYFPRDFKNYHKNKKWTSKYSAKKNTTKYVIWNALFITECDRKVHNNAMQVPAEAAAQMCSEEKVFWKYAANLLENTHAEERFQ